MTKKASIITTRDRSSYDDVCACVPPVLRYGECRGLRCAEPRAAVARAAARGCAPPPCASHRLCRTPQRSRQTGVRPAPMALRASRAWPRCLHKGYGGLKGSPECIESKCLCGPPTPSVQSLLSPRRRDPRSPSSGISAAPGLRGRMPSSFPSLFLSAASFTARSRLLGPLWTHSSLDRAERTVSFATRSPPHLHTRISLLRVTAHARTADASEYGE